MHIQQTIRRRFVDKLGAAEITGPHVVVSHSMGTVIAYDCLKRVADCAGVDGLITLGSPLGIDEVQDKLQPGWTRDGGYPSERVARRWVNLFDRLDPVCGFDPALGNDYCRSGACVVEDIAVAERRRLAPLDHQVSAPAGLRPGAARNAAAVAPHERRADPRTSCAAARVACSQPCAEFSSDEELLEAKRLVGQLRDCSEFELMAGLAEAISRRDPKDARNRRLYAQALIEAGKATAAIDLLQVLARRLAETDPEYAEVRV